MTYLVSALVAVAAVLGLGLLLVPVATRARRFTSTTRSVLASFADRKGLLTARIAALKFELSRRLRPGHSRTVRNGSGA